MACSIVLQLLIDAFSVVHNRFTNDLVTHIKGIHAFQSYFEVVYNPCDIRQTIYDVALTLKQKTTEKFTTLKVPPYVTDMYTFSLKFYFYKFPPLLTCELGLAFLLPFLDWIPCGSLSVLNKALKKLHPIVVTTKYYMDNYKGHLHVNIENVRVLSPILVGGIQDS